MRSSSCLSPSSWLHDLKWHNANQIHKPFATYSYFSLPAQKMLGRLFQRGGTVTSSARRLGWLCPPAAGDTAHLATKSLSTTTTAPRILSPGHPARLHDIIQMQGSAGIGSSKGEAADRKTGLGTQQFTAPHLSTVYGQLDNISLKTQRLQRNLGILYL